MNCVDGDRAGRADALENDAFGFGGSSMFGSDTILGGNGTSGLFGNAAATNDALAKFFAQAALLRTLCAGMRVGGARGPGGGAGDDEGDGARCVGCRGR